MFRIFNKRPGNLGTINAPLMPRIRDLVEARLTYQNYLWDIAGSPVPSNHILVTLAYIFSGYLERGMHTYRIIEDNLQMICNEQGITSDVTFGKLHQDQFYTHQNVIISTTFADQMLETDWTKVRAVRVLTHPMTSMDLFLPGVYKHQMYNGLTVIGIDLPLYGYQLKKWTEVNDLLPEGQQEAIAEFVSKYVLANMVPEYIDIALRNRLEYIYYDDPIPKTIHERSWAVSYSTAMEHPIRQVLKAIMTSRSTYLKGLSEIPMVFKNDYLEAVPMEIASLSTYSYWVVLIVYTDWVYNCLLFMGSNQKNITDINKILVRVDRILNSGMVLAHMPDEIKENWQKKYNFIKETLK